MVEVLIDRTKRNSIQSRWIAIMATKTQYIVRIWRNRTDSPSTSCECKCENGKEVFDFILSKTNKGESWWVAGWNMYECLCSMDLYDRIKDNTITLTRENVVANGAPFLESPTKLYGSMICENPPTIIDCQLSNKAKLKFLDLLNWGICKDMIIDEGQDEYVSDTVQAIQDYCTMVSYLGMGELKCTAASQGYYAYRHSHMPYDLVSDNTPAARGLERAAFFGGRNEAYRLGKYPGRIIHLDVKSMYTSFGFTERFPTRLRKVVWRPNIKKIMEPRENCIWIADVTVSLERPFLPVRHDGRILFPVGEFRTSLAYPELCLAMWEGVVNKVHVASEYETEPIFSCFAAWFKQSIDRLDFLGLSHMRSAFKLAINATYGKFGYRGRDWIDTAGDHQPYDFDQWWQRHPKNHGVVQWRSIAKNVQYLDSGSEPIRSMPSIPATMNSYGRVCLWRLMLIAGTQNVYYVDTDGLMVNEDGYDNLYKAGEINSAEMGKLRIREASDDVEVFGLKHYRFGQRYVCAGIPEAGKRVHSDRVEFEQHTPFTYSLWQKRGFWHRYDKRIRTHKPKIKHGKLHSDGRVLPFVMGEFYDERAGENNKARGQQRYDILGSVDPDEWH